MSINHATLPLWKDKSQDEKIEAIYRMTLEIYSYVLSEGLAKIAKILEEYAPYDDKERKDIEVIKQLMRENPNLLSVFCENGHFTGSALVVNVAKNEFLLHYHKKLKRWLQFGGHPELETDLSKVALREAEEETGFKDLNFIPLNQPILPVDIDVHIIPEKGNIPAHPHLDFRYILSTNELTPFIQAGAFESNEFKWFNFDHIDTYKSLIDNNLMRLILKTKKVVSQHRLNEKA